MWKILILLEMYFTKYHNVVLPDFSNLSSVLDGKHFHLFLFFFRFHLFQPLILHLLSTF